MLVSGRGFLYESALTVPFFRDGNIPDSMIVTALKDIKTLMSLWVYLLLKMNFKLF